MRTACFGCSDVFEQYLCYEFDMCCMMFFSYGASDLCEQHPARRVYPPSSGRHAMRCLYVIGRDGWVVGESKVLARHTFLPRSGSKIPIRSVAPRRCIFAASPK